MATHSSILAWRTLWTEEPQATVHGVTKSQTGLSTHTNTQGKLGEVAWPERLTFRGPVRTRPQCSRQAVLRISFVVILMDGDKACTDYSLGQRKLMIL